MSLPLWVSAWPADVMTCSVFTEEGEEQAKIVVSLVGCGGTIEEHHLYTVLLEHCPKEPPLPGERSSES